VENGFLWHPTLGVPYLPGAAVKGLVRAYVEHWDDRLDGGRQHSACVPGSARKPQGDGTEPATDFLRRPAGQGRSPWRET
jgi:CRISPR-associated protein Cmr6